MYYIYNTIICYVYNNVYVIYITMYILFQKLERNTHIFVEKVIFERIISSIVETSSSDMCVCLYVYMCVCV